MRDAEIENSMVKVRFDPHDASKVLAYINGQWVSCISPHHHILQGRSERYILIAAMELRQRNKRHGQNFNVRAEDLARSIVSLEAKEAELQALADAEAQPIVRGINTPISEEMPLPQMPGAQSTAAQPKMSDSEGDSHDDSVQGGESPIPRPRRVLRVN